MNISPISLVFTLLGGLLLAGILGWIRHARLIVLVPRLFTYSQLTSRGRLAEISVFNRGFKTEENIELTFNPNLQYEIVGSNSPDTSLSKSKFFLPRIGPGEEITALLLIEGGTFSKADIESCLSKESKGRIVAKLEDVSPTGSQRIGLVAFFVAVPLALYAMTYIFDYISKPETSQSSEAVKKVEDNGPIVLQGWSISKVYEIASGSLFKEFTDQELRVQLQQPIRKKNSISFPIIIENASSMPITYSLGISAPGSQEHVPFDEKRKTNVLVLPHDKSETRLTAILPTEGGGQINNTVYLDCFLESTVGDTLKMGRLVIVN